MGPAMAAPNAGMMRPMMPMMPMIPRIRAPGADNSKPYEAANDAPNDYMVGINPNTR